MSAPFQEYPDSRSNRWLVWAIALTLVTAFIGARYGTAVVQYAQEVWVYYTVDSKDSSQDPAMRGNVPTQIMGENPSVSGPAQTPLVPKSPPPADSPDENEAPRPVVYTDSDGRRYTHVEAELSSGRKLVCLTVPPPGEFLSDCRIAMVGR